VRLKSEFQHDFRDAAPGAERRISEDGGIGVGRVREGGAQRLCGADVAVVEIQGDVVRLHGAGECRVGVVDEVEGREAQQEILAFFDTKVLLKVTLDIPSDEYAVLQVWSSFSADSCAAVNYWVWALSRKWAKKYLLN